MRQRSTEDWLQEACSLLLVEAQDHEQNGELTKEQHRSIAKTLRSFVDHALKALQERNIA